MYCIIQLKFNRTPYFQPIDVKPYKPQSAECLCSVTLEADFMSKKT